MTAKQAAQYALRFAIAPAIGATLTAGVFILTGFEWRMVVDNTLSFIWLTTVGVFIDRWRT